MFIIIGGDGKEYGPVSAEQVRTWLANGRANLSTKAKYAGTEEWHTLGEYTEFVGGTAALPPLTAGAASSPAMNQGPVDAKAFAENLRSRVDSLDVFGCLGRSFSLWTSNFFPLVGVTLLVMLAQVVVNMIPLVNLFAAFCLKGVFYGGLYYYYLGKIRGEPRNAGDAFAGFTKSFVPLLLATLITTVILIAVMFACCAPLFMFFIQVALKGAQYIQGSGLPAVGGLTLLGLVAGLLILLYLSISWIFAFTLVIDQGLGPWTALEVSRRVVGKHWFSVFFVAFLGGLLTLLGIIGLFIGILFTLPLGIGAVLYAYEDLCNPPPRA